MRKAKISDFGDMMAGTPVSMHHLADGGKVAYVPDPLGYSGNFACDVCGPNKTWTLSDFAYGPALCQEFAVGEQPTTPSQVILKMVYAHGQMAGTRPITEEEKTDLMRRELDEMLKNGGGI